MVPLSRTRGSKVRYPDEVGVMPLLDVIEAPTKIKPVLQQIFGRYVVCENLDKCREISTRYALQCVTLDGDRMSPDGIINGGYDDPKRYSRITDSMKEKEFEGSIATVVNKLEDLETRILHQNDNVKKAGNKLCELTAQKEEVQSELRKIQLENKRDCSRLIELEKEVLWARSQHQVDEKKIVDTERLVKLASEGVNVEKLTRERDGLCREIQNLEKSMESTQKEEEAERKRRIALLATVEEKKNEIAAIDEKMVSLGAEKQKAESLDAIIVDVQRTLANLKKERKEAMREMKAIRKEVEDACEQKEILDPEIESLRSEFSRHHSSLDEKLVELQELRRKTERAEQIMKDLPVNNEDIESMKRKSATNIRKALATARQSLSNLGKVNIQAINSYFEIQKFTSKADQELEQYRTCVEEIAQFHDY